MFAVGKASLGAIHDRRLAPHLKVGLGGLYAWNFTPAALGPLYGRTDPHGAMAFMRLMAE